VSILNAVFRRGPTRSRPPPLRPSSPAARRCVGRCTWRGGHQLRRAGGVPPRAGADDEAARWKWVGEGCAVLCSSDAGKASAAKGGEAEVTELMALCVHRPRKYIATQYA
jgi:hypothetical protein